jgi:cystathionine beta-lyase/cystathionine gamma-synthase
MKPDDLCPRPENSRPNPTEPLSQPIQMTTVYRCEDPQQADALLAGHQAGYVYRRDDHPNADLLAEKCRLLHGAARSAVCASGMSALGAIVLSQLCAGDHLVVSNQLYGRSLSLLTQETARLGITASVVDTSSLEEVERAFQNQTRLLVAETIGNPALRVCDIAALAAIAHERGACLAVDNTFASPVVCRPLELGADFVIESLTKIMNGHSDVLLGALCGHERHWERLPTVLRSWGLMANPFECWLAVRGLGTLALRVERANSNAQLAAAHLSQSPKVTRVLYPGLQSHPDYTLARRQFGTQSGAMVTFVLDGGLAAAERLIRSSRRIPFSPSLGELCTTLSHPASTSHRALSEAARSASGIDGGMIRLSVGIESPEYVLSALDEALTAV